MNKLDRMVEIDEFEREALRQQIEFSKKPTWLQAVEEGDRLSDGSDEQPYEQEEDNV